MTTTYCQAADVAAALQLMESDGSSRLTFDGDSKPMLSEIDDWILEVEDWIDDYTLDSWRSISAEPETHRAERRSNVIGYGWPRSNIVYLRHNNITAMDNAQSDKLEVTISNDWVDILDPANGYEQGAVYGEGHFFVDTQKGRIYIYGVSVKVGPATIKVTYRYGYATVIRPIKRAAILLVSMRFLSGDDYINLFPDNPNNIALQSKHDNFEKEAYKLLDRYRRVISI